MTIESPTSGAPLDGEATTPAVPVLEARGVTKRFAGVTALDSVDFAVRPGESLALMGENGAGKSTLIKVLTGVYQPDDGELLLGGVPAKFARPLDARRNGVSTIYQEVNLIPLMSVAQNIFLGREPRNRFGLINFARMYADARGLLDVYGIDVDVRRPLRSLALGIQQMVALARSVSINARVVIMDEPTSSLEAREVETLFSVVSLLREQGIAIVYVSHRMDEIYRVAERVIVLRDGRVVHVGGLAELPRVELISLMLGRSVEKVTRGGTTAFGGSHASSAPPVLVADDLSRKHQIDGIDIQIRPGEVVGLGGLLGKIPGMKNINMARNLQKAMKGGGGFPGMPGMGMPGMGMPGMGFPGMGFPGMGAAPSGESLTKMKTLSDKERNAKKAQRKREKDARKKSRR